MYARKFQLFQVGSDFANHVATNESKMCVGSKYGGR